MVLNPATPLESIKHYAHLLDKITIMSVDPGFAGQPFIREMLDKIREAKQLKQEKGHKYLIEIDGSCNEKTFHELHEAGVKYYCRLIRTFGWMRIGKAWDKMITKFPKCYSSGYDKLVG